MDLRQLDHFVAVAEEQNFTRAARRVHIVQSALSTSIRGLEEELGTPLFTRNPRKVTLTPAGEVMLERARRLLRDVREAREAVAGIDGLLIGTLSVCTGLIQCLNPYLDLINLLAQFHKSYPGVHIRLRQLPTEPSLDELRSDRAEIALVIPPAPMPRGFASLSIARDRLAFVCCPTHPFASRRTVEATELRTENFIDLTRQWYLRRTADDYCRGLGLDRRISCEVNELATLFDLICSGIGVALVLRELAEQYRHRLAVIDLSPVPPVTEYAAVFRIDEVSGERRLNAAARAFLAAVEETVEEKPKKLERARVG